MKTLMTAMLLSVLGISLMNMGCATPGYSGPEQAGKNLRNMAYDNEQMIDDIDRALLLDPASMMTTWNLR